MAITNLERIGRGLDLLARGLRPFVEREMKSSAGDHWLSPPGGRSLGVGRPARRNQPAGKMPTPQNQPACKMPAPPKYP